jgi:4-hydroxybenzoate polyprenyltransferase
VALLAGATIVDALRLAAAMTLLQAGIGAANDLVDAPRDAGLKPGKPIPAGVVRPRAAQAIAIGAFATGLALAIPSGAATVGLAVTVIAIGLVYDLRLKGTPLSWLPFAVGIPVLPLFGWLGTTGSLPPAFAVLIPAAVAAGTGLAIANGLADVERDRAAGVSSAAVALGRSRAWRLEAILLAAVASAAVGSAALLGATAGKVLLVAVSGCLPLAGVLLGRSEEASRRERGWEIAAVGIAVLAIAWILVLLDTAAFTATGR